MISLTYLYIYIYNSTTIMSYLNIKTFYSNVVLTIPFKPHYSSGYNMNNMNLMQYQNMASLCSNSYTPLPSHSYSSSSSSSDMRSISRPNNITLPSEWTNSKVF